ncbi:hypothetical protein EJA71_13130 [Pseudomonas sp. PB106]|nr:hypothetical protein EJA71_13130 [Pseudomonas sp. PB106]
MGKDIVFLVRLSRLGAHSTPESRARHACAARWRLTPRNPVGASLLAKASVQSPLILNALPPSRASSLPHWVVQ